MPFREPLAEAVQGLRHKGDGSCRQVEVDAQKYFHANEPSNRERLGTLGVPATLVQGLWSRVSDDDHPSRAGGIPEQETQSLRQQRSRVLRTASMPDRAG